MKMVIFGVIGVVIAIASALGTVFILKDSIGGGAAANGEAPAAEAVEEKKEAIYYEFYPDFTVNIQGNGRSRFLQVKLVSVMYEPEVEDALKLHMPAIRNSLLALLSSQNAEELKSPEVKESLRVSILETVQQVMTDNYGPENIENLYFTNFVIQ